MQDFKIKVIEIVYVPNGVQMLKLGQIISITRLMYKANLMQDGISLSGIVDGGVYIFEPV